MRTKLAYIRIRETPDIKGAKMETLLDDALLEYLHDSTSFQTELKHRGRTYKACWYKVRTQRRKNEGWIFGAFVKWVPYLENKQIVKEVEEEEALLAASESGGMTKAQKEERKKPVQTSLVESYSAFLNRLSAADPYSMGKALDYFKSYFIGQNTRTCDAAFVELDRFHDRAVVSINQRGVGKYQTLKEEVMRYGRSVMRIDTFARALGNNGFNFSVKNGKIVVVKDVDFVFRIVYRECGTVMRSYMGQVETDQSMVWLDEGKLYISPLQLTRWALTWNYFVATNNEEFAFYEDAKKRLELQLSVLLNGTKQNPAFGQDLELVDDYKDAYLHIVQNYPDSKIGQTFQKYLDVLKESNWKRTSFVKQEQTRLMETLVGAEME